jgi:hypothetical protein
MLRGAWRILLTLAVGAAVSLVFATLCGHPAHRISESQAIASAQAQLPALRGAEVIGVREGRFDEFWSPGEEDVAAPRDRRVWAVAFRAEVDGSCGPAGPPGTQPRCSQLSDSIMLILDSSDGSLIETSSPAVGFPDQ